MYICKYVLYQWADIILHHPILCSVWQKRRKRVLSKQILNILAAFGNIEIETKHWRLTGQGQSNSRSVVHEGNGVTQ